MMTWLKVKFAELRERAKGWRTIIIGAIVASPLALLQLLEQFRLVDPAAVLPPPWGPRLALGVAIAMILLRLVTTGPVGSKGDDEPTDDTKAGD